MKKGIDVSAYQPNINWESVKGAGIEFVLIQLTQGLHYTNPLEVCQADQARMADIPFGYYHFGHPEHGAAADEARWFLTQIRRQDIPTARIIPALDIEQVYDGPRPVPLPPAPVAGQISVLEQWVADFAAVMASGGFPRIMIYSNAWYLDSCLSASHQLGRYPLWLSAYIAHEPAPPVGWQTIAIWQDSGKASVSGIPEPVDINECPDLGPILL